MNNEKIDSFLNSFTTSLANESFVKISLGNYKGQEEYLKNIYIKKITLKKEEKFSFTFRLQTKDMVKNYSLLECKMYLAQYLQEGFKAATLFTTTWDLILENHLPKKITLRETKPTQTAKPSLAHNQEKNRLIASEHKTYLQLLEITSTQGKVLAQAQDKYKQINHYIEILSSMLQKLDNQKPLHIVDMGSGKGYLTFALFDYLANTLNLNAHITGVEYRKELVELCNRIAQQCHYTNLQFVQGSIDQFATERIDILIALHACDTATDDAIAKGIEAHARLIVVSPCCHKQIRREIEKNKPKNELDFILRHGLYLEREAEMITDAMRILMLEYAGYKTKVVEFIADAHTPKNCLIIAEKIIATTPQNKEAVLLKIKNAKQFFGISYHHLEKLMGL